MSIKSSTSSFPPMGESFSPNRPSENASRITSIFPILIHEFYIENYSKIKKQLINYCYDERSKDHRGIKRSNSGNSWHSKIFYNRSENIISTTLKSVLTKYLKTYPVFKKETTIDVTTLWININSVGGNNAIHNHPNSNLSGVFWIKSPKNCGNLIFENPNNFAEFNCLNSYSQTVSKKFNKVENYFQPPKEGCVLLFPSHLSHRVEENLNELNEDRISVSFNIRVTSPKEDTMDTMSRSPNVIY